MQDFIWKLWRYVRWPLLVVVVLYIALVAWRGPQLMAEKRTAEAVAEIQAQRLTMADVDGSNLPPTPDPALVDATVEGIDANTNGIRDDVELAIFKKYPTNKKVRSGGLRDEVFPFANYIILSSDTPVRRCPSERCTAIAMFSKKSEVRIDGTYKNRTWYRINDQNMFGWIARPQK